MKINAQRITEEDLAVMIRLKKKEGAEALYDTYANALYLAIIRIVPEKKLAESVLEQTFITAWHSFATNSVKNEPVLARMMRIARKLANEIIDVNPLNQKP